MSWLWWYKFVKIRKKAHLKQVCFTVYQYNLSEVDLEKKLLSGGKMLNTHYKQCKQKGKVQKERDKHHPKYWAEVERC